MILSQTIMRRQLRGAVCVGVRFWRSCGGKCSRCGTLADRRLFVSH